MPNYIKTGTDEAGQKVGMLPDGTVEVIGPTKASKLTKPKEMPADIRRMTVALDALEPGLKVYEDMLNEGFNPRNPFDALSPTQRAKAASLMADLRMQEKEAQALGALTGPDIGILSKKLSDPTSLAAVGYGQAGLHEQIKQAREAIGRRRQALGKQFPEVLEGVEPPQSQQQPSPSGVPPNSATTSGKVRRRRYNLETGLFEDI